MSNTELDKKFLRGSKKLPANFKPEDLEQQQQQQTSGGTTASNGGAPQPPPSRKITLGNRSSPQTQPSTPENKVDTTELDNLDPVPITRPRTNRAATMIPSNLLSENKKINKSALKIGTDRNSNTGEEGSSISNSGSSSSDQLVFNKPSNAPPAIPTKRKSVVIPQEMLKKEDDDDDDDDENTGSGLSFSQTTWSNIMNKQGSFNFTNRNKGTGTGTGTVNLEDSNGGNEPSSRRGTFKKAIVIGSQMNDDDAFIEETSQKLSSLDLANVQRPKQQYHTIDPVSIDKWKKDNEEYLTQNPQDQQTQTSQGVISGASSKFFSILKNSPLSKSGQANANQSKGLTKSEVEYAEYLQKAKNSQFPDIEKLNFIYHAGKDNLGRTVIVIVASHLPVKETDMERVLLYTISIMDPVVESDYVLVYCHTNLTNNNKPSFAWLKKVYTIFNRKYKKNLKGLYIVHPTSWIKFILGLFKPFLSKKFWRKLTYIDDLTDLFKFFTKEQLNLPSHVMMHRPSGKKLPPIFGAPLEEVVQRPDNPNEIPVLFEKGLSYLERRALQVEGLFRLSGANSQIKSLRAGFDAGEDVDLEDVDDVHTVAGLLKLYLRELPQPLFPFDTYSSFIEIIRGDAPKPQKVESLKLLISLLPPANRALSKHLFKFLEKVIQNSHINKMNSVNLSIVFAPNILKDGGGNILNQVSDAQYVNQVVQLILENISIIIC